MSKQVDIEFIDAGNFIRTITRSQTKGLRKLDFRGFEIEIAKLLNKGEHVTCEQVRKLSTECNVPSLHIDDLVSLINSTIDDCQERPTTN